MAIDINSARRAVADAQAKINRLKGEASDITAILNPIRELSRRKRSPEQDNDFRRCNEKITDISRQIKRLKKELADAIARLAAAQTDLVEARNDSKGENLQGGLSDMSDLSSLEDDDESQRSPRA